MADDKSDLWDGFGCFLVLLGIAIVILAVAKACSIVNG